MEYISSLLIHLLDIQEPLSLKNDAFAQVLFDKDAGVGTMQEERIYRLLFEHSVQGMVLRQGERIILVNQSFADMVGYTIDELLDFSMKDALNLIHPQDREMVLARFNERLAGKDLPNNYEYRFIRRNGETGWWSATVSTIDYGGQPSVLGIYVDITERQKTEETIQRGRELLAATLDILPVGVCLTDKAGHYQMMNDAYCAIYEYDREEMLGQHYSVIMPPDQVAMANAHYARLLSGDMGIPVERKRQRKDGSIVYIEAANALVEGVSREKMVITTVRDITERVQARAEIERLAQNLSERVKELNCLYGIAQLIDKPGTSLESIVEGTAHLIPPAFQYPEITCARITLGDSTFATDNYSETPWRLSTNIVAFGKIAGTLDVYLLEAKPEANEGPFLAEERTLIDAVAERLGRIVERMRTEATLKQSNAELQTANEEVKRSEQRYRTLFEATFEGICVHEQGVLLDANPVFAKMFGYSHSEIVGMSVLDLAAEESRQLVRDKVLSEDERPYEAVGQRKDGTTFDGELLGKKYVYEGRSVRVTALRDITERKKIERHQIELALERERMQILTNFITQASHEFRTPLSVIGTNAYLLKQHADTEEQQQRIQIIEEQVGHIAKLVQKMVTLSKLDSGEQELVFEEVDLREIIRAAYHTLHSLSQEKHHKITLDLGEEPLHVQGEFSSLQQTTELILENAIRYTPNEGAITVRTDCVDDQAVIKIIDTGIGMSEDVLPHIFDRFCRVDVAGTTRGFGLGLSIAKAIIDKHQGRIKVDSTVGHGSVFSIWLPTARSRTGK